MASDRYKPEPASDDPAEPAPAGAFTEVSERLSEARDYAAYYIAAKIDQLKLSARNVAIYAVLGGVGLLVGGTLAVMAVVLFCLGAAGGLGALFGMGTWLGALVLGFALLLVIGGGLFGALMYVRKTFKQRTVNAYEQRKRQQRGDHGTDVHQRAEEQWGDQPVR
jgi:hypothetical protein